MQYEMKVYLKHVLLSLKQIGTGRFAGNSQTFQPRKPRFLQVAASFRTMRIADACICLHMLAKQRFVTVKLLSQIQCTRIT
jgi:hypothetical protein